MDHASNAVNAATDRPGKINTPAKLDLRAVLDVSARPAHADVGEKSVCFLWWYMSSGSTQSTMVDASVVQRVWPLVKSGYVARNMHEWLERVRKQYEVEPDPKAGLRMRPHTNWRKICGRTKAEVVTEILIGLAERLERGEITPAPKRRGRLAKSLESWRDEV